MRFKVVNYSRLEIRLDTLHIYTVGYIKFDNASCHAHRIRANLGWLTPFGASCRGLRFCTKISIWQVLHIQISKIELHTIVDARRRSIQLSYPELWLQRRVLRLVWGKKQIYYYTDSFSTMAHYKSIYLLTYLFTYLLTILYSKQTNRSRKYILLFNFHLFKITLQVHL